MALIVLCPYAASPVIFIVVVWSYKAATNLPAHHMKAHMRVISLGKIIHLHKENGNLCLMPGPPYVLEAVWWIHLSLLDWVHNKS